MVQEILGLTNSGLLPKAVLTTLRTKYGPTKVVLTTKDISNICQGNRLRSLEGRTPTQTLLDDLEANRFEFDKDVDEKVK